MVNHWSLFLQGLFLCSQICHGIYIDSSHRLDCSVTTSICRDRETLTQVPDMNNSTTQISLVGNQITSLSGSVFSRYPDLRNLDMRENLLNSDTVDATAFCGTSLVVINLKANDLERFPNLTCLAETLENITVAENRIQHVNTSHLGPLHKLRFLYMAKNTMKTIEHDAFCGTKLENINLSDNDLQSIPNVSCVGCTLWEFRINKNSLANIIPEDSFKFNPALELLDLRSNTIVDISSLAPLGPTIQTLLLGINKITAIGDVFYNFVRLDELDLRSNRLKYFRLVRFMA